MRTNWVEATLVAQGPRFTGPYSMFIMRNYLCRYV